MPPVLFCGLTDVATETEYESFIFDLLSLKNCITNDFESNNVFNLSHCLENLNSKF